MDSAQQIPSTFRGMEDEQVAAEAAVVLRTMMLCAEKAGDRIRAAATLLEYIKPKKRSISFEGSIPIRLEVVSALSQAEKVLNGEYKDLGPSGPAQAPSLLPTGTMALPQPFSTFEGYVQDTSLYEVAGYKHQEGTLIDLSQEQEKPQKP